MTANRRRWIRRIGITLAVCAGLVLMITGGFWGSSPSSWTHTMLAGAGLNWHLFETIDVVKHDSGDTLHLPVAPLAAATDTVETSEQLPVPGVPMPQWGSDRVSWGVVENTNGR